VNDRRQIFGWAMYDWANSAYATTVVVAVLPALFAAVIVPSDGFPLWGRRLSASTLWGAMISLSAFVVFVSAPVLGAIADFSASKKRFLLIGCYVGSAFTVLLAFCGPGDVWLTMAVFVVSQICFVGANVFYDAFLPHIASEDKLDWVSGKGFAFGYLGGGIQFALALGLIAAHDRLGISEELAARLALAMTGLWWGGFALVTVALLEEPAPAGGPGQAARFREWKAGADRRAADRSPQPPSRGNPATRWWTYVGIGFRRTLETARKVRRFRHLLLFLIAYMIYYDGIETVIVMATIYGKDELKFSTTHLMLTLLVIQAIALVGALVFGKLAGRYSTKTTLMLTLGLWAAVVIYAYRMTTPGEFFALGVIVGVVLGGSQALSRSLYGSMIPVEASAEFYGFYSVFNKFSAIWGPLVFAIIRETTGSSRQAILSLIVFFLVGLVLLSLLDVDKARQARASGLFGGAGDGEAEASV
jgi:MFS transporter, UMF1 family